MSGVHPLLRKALALSLLLALLFAAWQFLAAPLIGVHTRYGVSIDRSRDLLVRYAEISAGADGLKRQLAEVRTRQSSTVGFLEGKGEDLLTAEMQEKIKTVVEASGGRLKSTQTLTAVDEERMRRLSVRVNMIANVEALQKVLHEFENAEPYLFVEKLNIQASRATRRRGRRQVRGNPDDLQVRFDIHGFVRREDS